MPESFEPLDELDDASRVVLDTEGPLMGTLVEAFAGGHECQERQAVHTST